ncbi:DciA family protein [Streptomyces sp. DSM 40868]|uniref:DciA family protein n=1 Tax=Streptomyces sp. DSM 40868 TaxID=2721173 RepID=UPI001FCB423D|nr:DciA family protein [Streptomyces sp. DSM 40868]
MVGRVRPVHYEPATRQLDLLPLSPAYATQLRLLGRQLIARINAKTGQETVKELRVLAPGSGAATPADFEADREGSPVEKAPVKTREMACAGYHQALAAHQTARPDRHVDPAIAEAIESQTRALRQLSRLAFPDPNPEDQPSPIEAARAQRRRQAAATEAAALRRARAERAARRAGAAAAQPPAVRRSA